MARLPASSATVIRFSGFEVDLRTRELRKGGAPVPLQGQPFHVLAELLARPGDLITREELQRGLWEDGTFVDAEHNLNTIVKRLREALNDSAETPR
jgi:DNA-binding response OmpR family regulator